VCQDNPVSVILSDLIASPKKFDETVVKVQGVLVIENQPRHAPLVILYQGQEDARDHSTKNGILVIPNSKMIHGQEQINRRRVSVTGTFYAVQGPSGSYSPLIKSIRKCVLLPD